ncbi:MAG: ATP-binding protein [Candidatus Aminicenantes bacterium]|nr:ATP-binding protein [Candidatus Aminicenantes bacterium]
MKFYNREKELELIKKTSRAAVLGRRRIGKTRLLHEAMTGRFIYLFFFNDAAEPFIIEKWSKTIRKQGIYLPNLRKIGDILEYLFNNINLPIIIDEIQNSVKKYPEFISHLQQLSDQFKQQELYITGSLISMMKKVVENYKSPIFGRFDFIIKLKELDIKTILEIMSDLGYSDKDALLYYSVFGGIPKYYELIESLKPTNFNEFVNLMFFEYPRPLYTEIYIMLKEEIGKNFSNYFGILNAISQRGNTFGKIASAMNMKSTSVSKYLNDLIHDYELVRGEQPTSKKKKKTLYSINSNIIDFWFTFCFKQREELDRGNERYVYEEYLKQFPTFYGYKFERSVIGLLPGYLQTRGIDYRMIGKDWGKDYEFDFTVEGKNNEIYIGEIKKGELNVAIEIEKMESIVKKETFYKDKFISYILLADRFTNKIEKENILYIPLDEGTLSKI